MDLMINILYVFYSFSHFSQFHEIITKFKVGVVVMEAIAYEEKRREKMLKKKENKNENKKVGGMITKQENLLYVCFRILLNLAENIDIESKMKKRGLIPNLVNALDSENPELLCVLVTFLRKLSIFQENRREMLDAGLMFKFEDIFQYDNIILLNESMRLIVNVTFDPQLRKDVIPLVPKFIELLRFPDHFEYCVKLLYQLSQDEEFSKLRISSDTLPFILLEFVAEYPGTRVSKELIALAINVTLQEQLAVKMCLHNNGLTRLLERLVRTRDPFLAKMIRNISQHTQLAIQFKPFVNDILGICSKAENDELVVELLGMLGNMSNSNVISFSQLFKQFDLVAFLFNFLKKGVKTRSSLVNSLTNVEGDKDDDILLESIILLGNAISDDESAALVANSPMIITLCNIFIEKQEDDEIVLQTMYTFYKMLLFGPTREGLMSQHHIIKVIIELYQDENEQIASTSDMMLDIICECDGQWTDIIKRKKYFLYNEKWLTEIANLPIPRDISQVDEGVPVQEESSQYDMANVIDMSEVSEDMEIGTFA
ncbi:hypothetical protein NAEGRDRAFT_79669 [Naegleria gruberi]|uniref:Kinesin-associated protein n=1 Tax=Naegleria gruberi TaxID=5762 RepID=D2VEK7_NAEGR|nr:uncharacterized protein NAEGRDRAFT_79669 [Naegleria gruberi]EFC44901.1 hypothetical protein NAEGRDRAFT_79669 [Naegleria gruberi]|eukprot:XP_002677645.1 hypothetical protein NAEGRDRAFT_79669 [Naegleria gruberi strain NEG-M]